MRSRAEAAVQTGGAMTYARHLLRCIVLLVAMGFLLLIPRSAAAAKLTLSDVLAKTYATNPVLEAERAQFRAKSEDLSQARGAARPTINAHGSTGYLDSRVSGSSAIENAFYSNSAQNNSYGVGVAVPIYQGGTLSARVKSAALAVRSERAKLVSVEQKVLLQAITDYLNVARDGAIAELYANHVRIEEQRAVSARARRAGGAASRLDVAQAESSYQESLASFAQSQTALAKSQAEFERDTGLVPSELAIPQFSLPLPENLAIACEKAAVHNPDVISAQYDYDSARSNIDIVLGQALPALSLEGDYQWQDTAVFKNGTTTQGSVVLRLTMPLYSGGVLEAKTRNARQTADVYRHQFDSARAAAVAATKTIWWQSGANKTSEQAYRSQVSLNELAYKGTRIQYEAGEKTMLDVLNAERALLDAKISLERANHDLLLSQWTLYSTWGELTANTLRLDVKQYDAEKYLEAAEHRWFGFGIDEQ